MRNIIKLTAAITVPILIVFGCKKDVVPTVETIAITDITGTTAKSGGNVKDEGSSTVLNRGVCWSISSTPTIEDTKTVDGAGAGTYSSSISNLNGSVSYFVRAYATNEAGTGYGMAYSFKTLGDVPLATIESVQNITVNSATLKGSINPNYLSTLVIFEYGKTQDFGNTVDGYPKLVDGNQNVLVSADISSLEIATEYHYRLKSINSLGTSYSSKGIFKTLGQVPSAEISSATDITLNSARLNGAVNANYLSTNAFFEYGKTTNYGTTVTLPNTISGNSNTWINVVINDLEYATDYHFRIKAINVLGTTYSSDKVFRTSGWPPVAETKTATVVDSKNAILNGAVNQNLLPTTMIFEYGPSIDYGSVINAITGPWNSVSANITNLTAGTTYHYRVVAENALGKVYGADMTFTSVYAIGENANGGIIFYLDQTKLHGLVTATQDQGTSKWGCMGVKLTSQLGASGSVNTPEIVAGCSTTNIAARLCSDLSLTGYDDWYLPSIEELGKLYASKSFVNNLNTNSYYWSSSELDENRAYCQFFGDFRQDYYSKDYEFQVRAIRIF